MLAAQAGVPGWVTASRQYGGELATVSYRIAVSAGDYCPEKAPLLGFSIHDLSQYGASDRKAVKAAYGFAGYPLVLAVAAGGPAARGGLAVGDSLIAVEGQPVPPAAAHANSYQRVSAVWALLDDAARHGPVRLTLQRGESEVSATVSPVMGCNSLFELGSSSQIDAVADDSEVVVNVGALQFAEGEDEAAAIVAHELSHNILHHREKIAVAPRGQRLAVASNAEQEADRLSIALLERAGYDPQAILRFWQRFLTQFPANRRDAALQTRVALIRTELGQIEQSDAVPSRDAPDVTPAPAP
jgi:hypothetical protein